MKLLNLSKTLGAFALGLSLLTVSAQSNAAALDLNQTYPDIVSGFLSVDYLEISNELNISGYALELADDASTTSTIDFSDINYQLNAIIDETGTFVSGSFDITGTIAGRYETAAPLLSGTLDAFGFTDAGTLEFTYNTATGQATDIFNDIGGIIIGFSGYENSIDGFNTNWSNEGNIETKIDTFSMTSPVPEPSTILLFGLGLITVFGFARRQSIKSA
ncbi:MAG: PEP-CTERM sorting domain-containing protein [Pseudomonadota bacterium]|nr:PEP-CTERM sorting domain-containing protein [Pseudomonadota bacterium]